MVIKYFTSWLKKNNHRFNHPLQVLGRAGISDEYPYIKLKYKGIIPDIYVKVMDNCIQVQVNYRDSYFDTICDFEIEVEKFRPGGYGCTLCREHDENRFQTYKTARELIAAHVYEDLLNWSNRYISTANFLLYQGNEGFSAALVKPQDEIVRMLNKDEDEFIIQILALGEYINPMG